MCKYIGEFFFMKHELKSDYLNYLNELALGVLVATCGNERKLLMA